MLLGDSPLAIRLRMGFLGQLQLQSASQTLFSPETPVYLLASQPWWHPRRKYLSHSNNSLLSSQVQELDTIVSKHTLSYFVYSTLCLLQDQNQPAWSKKLWSLHQFLLCSPHPALSLSISHWAIGFLAWCLYAWTHFYVYMLGLEEFAALHRVFQLHCTFSFFALWLASPSIDFCHRIQRLCSTGHLWAIVLLSLWC